MARGQILDALVTLLDSNPMALPSLRAVAGAAGVSAALLHYHFEDQLGLMRRLHEERAMPLLQPLLQDLQTGDSNAGAALARFLQKLTVLGERHPWLAPCLLQEPAPGAVSVDWAGKLREVVASAQRQGTVRRDLPDSYIALLLLSLALMPHIARTSLGAGIDALTLADSRSAASLTLQHLSVLRAGVAS